VLKPTEKNGFSIIVHSRDRMEFAAAAVSIEEDADLWRVAFADAEFNPRRYLLLQREKSPDPQDVELGLDGYQVEVNDQANACYGGIESFELFEDRAVITFEDEAMPGIDADEVVVRFALRPRQRDQLRTSLARIFDGSGCFLDAAS
jgi:immunity protein 10 of polymorphic toxin system